MYKYTILFTGDIGKALPSFGKVIDEVNGHMQDFGFSEKMMVRSPIFTMTIDTLVTLTEEQKTNILNESLAVMKGKFPEFSLEAEFDPIFR